MHKTITFRRVRNCIVDSNGVYYYYSVHFSNIPSNNTAIFDQVNCNPTVEDSYSLIPVVDREKWKYEDDIGMISLEYQYSEKLTLVSIAMIVLLEHPGITVEYHYVDGEITKIELLNTNGKHFHSHLYPSVMTFFCGVPMRSIFKDGNNYHNTNGPAVIQWPFTDINRYNLASRYNYKCKWPHIDMERIIVAYFCHYTQFMKYECTKEYWVENTSIHVDLVDNEIVDLTNFDETAKFACLMMPVGVDRLW